MAYDLTFAAETVAFVWFLRRRAPVILARSKALQAASITDTSGASN